ncbi:MAG: hypothetical protein ABIL09_19655 [Gemmatimonadota bacterium]
MRRRLLAQLAEYRPGYPVTAADLILVRDHRRSALVRRASAILHAEWRAGRIGAVEEHGPRGGRGFYRYGGDYPRPAWVEPGARRGLER